LLGETKETKDENFGDAVILITPFGNLCRCTIILPTSLPPNNIHVKHSAYVTVLSPSVGYGVDVEEGYDFVQSHLSEILSSLPSVFVCIPESWEPEEVCDRYKGMEAFKGVVKDGTKDAWHVWQRLDNSSLPPSLWDGHAVFKRVSNMVSKTRMNGTERKGLSLLLMNDIVEEYETLSQVITVERREIERNCGKVRRSEGRLERSDSKSILPPSSINNNIPFVASLIAGCGGRMQSGRGQNSS
jgi:hypothetical protein